MKSLDEYIKKNSELFDSDEPQEGHFERFDSKLERVGRQSTFFIILRIAAVVILGLVISYAAMQEYNLLNRGLGKIITANEYPELREAEQFYNVQLDLYYTRLEKLRFSNGGDQKKQIFNELSYMDKEVRTMKRDLRQNPGDERIVNAIINYYQVKLELMDMVITRTQKVNNTIL